MQAITFEKPGGPEVLRLATLPDPEPAPEELLVEVFTTALNRADLLQRKGHYPPPAGASEILGLEICGRVIKKGESVSKWREDDIVFGLIPGGGYAEKAVIHQDMAMQIPGGVPAPDASAIPEVFLTAYQALFWLGQLADHESLLIHAGASGVGTAAIQLAKTKKTDVFVTASAAKHDICYQLGADAAFDYTTGRFDDWLKNKCSNNGINLILDFIGSSYFPQNLNVLSMDGKLIQLALLGGSKAKEVDLGTILRKRIQIIGSTLRNRSLEYQIRLTKAFYQYAKERFERKELKPIIGKVFDWKDVQEAHRYMESNQNIGKILLHIKEP